MILLPDRSSRTAASWGEYLPLAWTWGRAPRAWGSANALESVEAGHNNGNSITPHVTCQPLTGS